MKEHFKPDEMYVGRDIHTALEEFEAQIRDQTAAIMEQRNHAENIVAETKMQAGVVLRQLAALQKKFKEREDTLMFMTQQLADANAEIERLTEENNGPGDHVERPLIPANQGE